MFVPRYSSDDFNQTSLNLLRSGTVVDRRNGTNGPEVRVAYEDRGITSDWLPISQHTAGGMTSHVCPRKGANVIVAHLGTGIEHGVVLGSSPTQNGGAIIPNSLNSHAMLADDGAQFEYNPDTGNLHIGGVKTVQLIGAGQIAITTGGDVDTTTGANVNISAANVTIKAGSITLDGNVTITQNLTVKGTTHMKQAFADPNCNNADGSGGGT